MPRGAETTKTTTTGEENGHGPAGESDVENASAWRNYLLEFQIYIKTVLQNVSSDAHIRIHSSSIPYKLAIIPHLHIIIVNAQASSQLAVCVVHNDRAIQL